MSLLEKGKVLVQTTRGWDYIHNYREGMNVKPFKFIGEKKGKRTPLAIPYVVYEDILYNTCAFKDGDLEVLEVEENKEAIEDGAYILEEGKKNTHTRAEIVAVLKSSKVKELKAMLDETTDMLEKQRFVQIAKEEKVDSKTVLNAIAKSVGGRADVLFFDEDDAIPTINGEEIC